MTKEEIMELDSDAVEARCTEIAEAIEAKAEGTDFEALSQELEFISERKAALVEQKKADIEAVMEGEGSPVENIQIKEERTMDLKEIRSSEAYVNSFADYLKNNDDKECRKLLSENGSGVVPVPVIVEDIVRTAWEREGIMSRVKKTYLKGNIKVGFEISADGAVIHTEGADAPSEEKLVLGVVTLVPASIKKWITISDEMMETTGEGFVRYVYEELAYQVMKKLSYEIVGDVKNCAYTTNQSNAVGIPVLKKDPGIGTIVNALAMLSDEAQNICIVLNPASKPAFFEAYAAGNFAVDPFQGFPVIFSRALESIATASENGVYGIVGDLSAIQVNFPAGEGLKLINDPYSLAEKDLLKIVGRVYAGHGVTAPGRLVKLTKEAAAVTT